MFGSWLTGNFLYPLHERLVGRRTFACLREMLAARRLGDDETAALQDRKLQRILTHAFRHTTFYRLRMTAAGVNPERDDPRKVLEAMPLLTRSDIREHLPELTAAGVRRVWTSATSGSSGEPLRFLMDPARAAADKAARLRAQMDWGVGPGDRKVWLWGVPAQPTLADRVKAIRDRVLNERLLSAYDMTAERMREYVSLLCRWRPRSVTCYPSAAWRLCRFATDEGLDLRRAGIAVWFATGEVLQERHREAIRNASGARVANEYGLREAGFVAHECPEGTMHVTAESAMLETVLPDGSPAGDEIGEIVVTNLDAMGMPLVRYRTKDYARLARDECPCGWRTQSLADLAGRQTDFLVDAHGTPKVGFAASRRFWDVPGVRQFRIVQESLERTRVLIVGGAEFDEAAKASIAAIVRDLLGPGVQVDVETVETIPVEPSGTTSYVQSLIADQYL